MSGNGLQDIFETVLTASPPDTGDIETVIRLGRVRRRRRSAAVLVSSVAVAALAVGVTTMIVWPEGQQRAAVPAVSASGRQNEATMVSDARDLLGTWRTAELDGQDVSTVRDRSGKPLTLTFKEVNGQLRWTATDVLNGHSGTFDVSTQGRFQAIETGVTAVGSTGTGPRYVRNAEVVVQATSARLLSASPEKLMLLAGDKVVATFARTE